jgi:hypothetical protein
MGDAAKKKVRQDGNSKNGIFSRSVRPLARLFLVESLEKHRAQMREKLEGAPAEERSL